MIRLTLYICCFYLSCNFAFAQDNARVKVDTSKVDTNYREDQFYASVTYNLLGKKPAGISQSGFSSGFHAGFIRDMPFNQARNLAIGVGVGLSTNSYNQNLKISEIGNNLSYSVLSDSDSYTKNKFTTYILEFPFEFRWRTSTATSYDFWRIYTGFKIGYVFYNTAKYEGEPMSEIVSNIKDFNRLQYGLSFAAGYDTINVHLYYALNNLFNENARMEEENVGMNAIKIGLIFYIL